MNSLKLFPTEVFIHEAKFDLDKLYEEIKDHQSKTPNRIFSNRGGYQGGGFKSKYFEEQIKYYIPQRPDLRLTNYNFDAWVNINPPGSKNEMHEHISRAAFISGVLYIKVPKNSGNIVFHDPRHFLITQSEPLLYYNRGNSSSSYSPKENELLLFPYWLVHNVEENLSNEDRISISFNITHIDVDIIGETDKEKRENAGK